MYFKKVWMGYETQKEINKMFPYDNENTEKSVNEIGQLLKEGWKIASTSPVTASTVLKDPFSNQYHTYTFTSGIEIFLIKE